MGAFNAEGTLLFVLSDRFPERVSAFAADATTGGLTLLGSVDAPGYEIVVHPGGKYAYLRGGRRHSGRNRQPDRSHRDHSACTSRRIRLRVGLDNRRIGRVRSYFLDNGLTPIGSGPGLVSAFRIDEASGALTPLAGSPVSGPGGASLLFPSRHGPNASLYRRDQPRRGVHRRDGCSVRDRSPRRESSLYVPGSPFTPTVGTTPGGGHIDPLASSRICSDYNSFLGVRVLDRPANGSFIFVGSYPVGGRPLTFARIAGLQ